MNSPSFSVHLFKQANGRARSLLQVPQSNEEKTKITKESSTHRSLMQFQTLPEKRNGGLKRLAKTSNGLAKDFNLSVELNFVLFFDVFCLNMGIDFIYIYICKKSYFVVEEHILIVVLYMELLNEKEEYIRFSTVAFLVPNPQFSK